MIQISFPDGSNKKFPQGITGLEIALDIGEGFSRKVLSMSVNGNHQELSTPISESSTIEFYTWDSKKGKYVFWHSSAHVLAQTILYFYPNAKLSIGPPIENGFYYDFDFGEKTFSEKEFEKIEKRFLENARLKYAFELYPVSKKDALKSYENNEYKTELIQNLEDGSITFCKHADFVDLCKGVHLPNTGFIKAIKILSIAGAYWRGDEKNKQLTRIYAISFPKKKQLDDYLHKLEEAKKRDHRKLGREMELFTFSKKVGQGLPLWLPKGAELRKKLENFIIDAQLKAGYEFVVSPHIGRAELYITSGHYEKYASNSFHPISTPNEGEKFLLKPMNCPHHCEIYNSKLWSYKELPVRYAEFGVVYRYEQSGELHGLARLRGFTQDDAHLFCRSDQLLDEFEGVIDLVLYLFKTLGFEDFMVQVSLRDPNDKKKYIGSDEKWEKAEKAIIQTVENKQLKASIEYGEAAFYGPKLDFMVNDALDRKWQLGTIQVDYNLPERFNLTYKESDNRLYRPVMIHRALFGSLERFIAVLIEHTAGELPLWLIPIPVRIMPISDQFNDYAEKVLHLLNEYEIRSLVDSRNEKINKKIRDAEVEKVPFMLIVGKRENDNNTLSIRKHKQGDIGEMKISDFIEMIKEDKNNFK